MTIKRAGLYPRVSTEEQAKHGYSIQTQIDDLTEYCDKNNIKIVDIYSDEGVSGGKSAFKRPAMTRLLDDVQAGKIDVILFTKLDRWFRSVKEYYKVQDILDNHGVSWKAIQEDYETETSSGRFKVNIMLSVAQNERERTAERIKVVLNHKRRNKEACFGGPFETMGYTKELDENGVARLVKNPETEQMTIEFWDIMKKHKNVNRAIRHMNDVYGVTKSPKTWTRIVRNELYSGTYKGIDGFCEPYIDRKEWEEIQNRTRTKYPTGHGARIYLFAGMLRCPSCGNVMCGSYKTETYRGIKREYKSYRCRFYNTHCETKPNLSEKKIESFLLNNIEQLLKDEIARVEIENNKPKPKPKYNMTALRERLRRLEVVYMAGNKSDEEYLLENNEIKELIRKAESEAPPRERDLQPLVELLEMDFASIYQTLSDEEKRRLWQGIVKEIGFSRSEFKRGKPYDLDIIFF